MVSFLLEQMDGKKYDVAINTFIFFFIVKEFASGPQKLAEFFSRMFAVNPILFP